MEFLIEEQKKELEEEVGTFALKQNDAPHKNDVMIIIMLEKNPNFKGFIKPYELPICGKQMWEWVKMAVEDYPTKTITCTSESDVLSLIKPFLGENKWTFVLYSDTPLLKKNTVEEILSYAEFKDLNVLTLSRGFVFKTEYIKQAETIMSSNIEYFDEEDFMSVYDFKQLSLVTEIMKNRIMDFHFHNGVFIENPNSCQIDADVIIESGTKLFGCQNLRGKCIIGKNCILDGLNHIENSIISDNCKIVNSFIEGSRISENMVVGPFEGIIKKST